MESNNAPQGNVAVVVLGEIGRSPRMQYHSLSLHNSKLFKDVYIISYPGSESGINLPLSNLIESGEVVVRPLKQIKSLEGKHGVVWIIKAVWKVLLQTFNLFKELMAIPSLSVILVQNPPSVPTLIITHAVTLLRGTSTIVDWHNYGYSLLAMSKGSLSHPSVKLYRWIEESFGRKAKRHICVTKAMRTDLLNRLGIEPTVVYDRPPSFFQTASIQTQHKLFCKLAKEWKSIGYECDGVTNTPFTASNHNLNQIVKRKDRSALIVSSTSWTVDEDFSILLNALIQYNHRASQLEASKDKKKCCKLIVIITGKGPMKEYYLNEIKKHRLQHVSILTMWLSAEDYSTLLGSADLGISLHSSSSGLDLPMKVVDMFGSGLPVCALKFKCLHELVVNGKNGLVFNDSDELAAHLWRLFKEFPQESAELDSMKEQVKEFQKLRWEENWNTTVRPLLNHLS